MKNKLILFIFIVLALFLCQNHANAQWKFYYPQPADSFQKVLCLASNNNYLFAGLAEGSSSKGYQHGIVKSSDNGMSWTTADSGLPNSLIDNQVNCLMIIGNKLFAGYNFGGIFMSTDNGSSWMPSDAGIPHTIINDSINANITAFDTANGNIFVSVSWTYNYTQNSLYISTDTGASWKLAEAGLSSDNINYTTPGFLSHGDTLFFGTHNNGIDLSMNEGTLWAYYALRNNQINAMADINGNLFAGTQDSGIFRSTDNGATWERTDNNFPSNTQFAVTSMVTAGNILFAGTNIGVYFSRNNGGYWECIDSIMNTTLPVNLLYLYNNYIYGGGGGLVIGRRSLSDYMHSGTSILLTPDSLLFTITSDKSTYNDTLHITNTGANTLIIDSATIHDKNINVSFQDSILPGAQGTIVLTLTYTNQNDTIEKLVVASNDSVIPFDTIDVAITYPPAILLNRDSVVFHVGKGNGTYTDTLSITNIGKQTLNIDSVSNSDNNLIVILPSRLVSGAQSEILLQLAYSGQRDTTEKIIIVTNDPAHPRDTVYVVITATSPVIESALPADFSLNVYPNPFSSSTTISYTLPTEEPVTLAVYNALGQAIAMLANASEAGAHTAVFTAAGLQSGMYFYRLTAGRNVQTGTMAVVK